MRISRVFWKRFNVRAVHEHLAFAFSIVAADKIGRISHLFEYDCWLKGRAQFLIFHAPVIAFNQALISDAVESITDLLFFVEVISVFGFRPLCHIVCELASDELCAAKPCHVFWKRTRLVEGGVED